MADENRLLIDEEIDRRTFMRRLGQAGISVAAANSSESLSSPEPGRILENISAGDVMFEFLMDWDVPYLFGLAGSEYDGRPYVVDVIITKRFEGKDSDYDDYFSVAEPQNSNPG